MIYSWRWVLVTVMTLAGLCLGAVGVYHRLWPLMILSLLIDGLDGQLARRLGVETPFGAFLDWHTDVALAHVTAWTFFGWIAPLVTLFLVFIQSASRTFGERLSGRTLVFLAASVLLGLGAIQQ